MAIPKILHIIWVGDESKRPDRWIETWRRMNPSYHLQVWGNDEVSSIKWVLADRMTAWAAKEIPGLVDLVRWEILFRYGGIALDADSVCLRPLEDWLIETDAFAAWENEIVRPGLIATGALGFIPRHPLVARILDDLAADDDLMSGRAWQKTGPLRLTNTVGAAKHLDLSIYPSHFFLPRHYTGLEYKGSGPVFARQFWGSTHLGWGMEYGSGEVAADSGRLVDA